MQIRVGIIPLIIYRAVRITDSGISCSNPDVYKGKTVCDFSNKYCGECVSFVKKCTGDGRPTSQWRQGTRVFGTNIPFGTAIATFVNGRYSGHAAIYVSQNRNGIVVWDQWRDHPVSQRPIGLTSNQFVNKATNYYVIQ